MLFILILSGFEYMSLKILTTPYSELNANSDKYHPIVAYIFFGSLVPLISLLLILYIVFLLQKGRGLYLTNNGFIDQSTPFAIGEIPFERILQICNSTNNVTRYRGIKIRDNKLSFHLRRRKVDNAWWESNYSNSFKAKIFKWLTRFGIYNINTKVFSASHEQLASAVAEHIKTEPRIQIYSMDVERTFKELKEKRRAEKKLLRKRK